MTRELLEELKYGTLYFEIGHGDCESYNDAKSAIPEVTVYDSEGNRAVLEYGDNGYVRTGFRADSQCNQCDASCFPIFKALEDAGGRMISCDGGSTGIYEDWKDEMRRGMRK